MTQRESNYLGAGLMLGAVVGALVAAAVVGQQAPDGPSPPPFHRKMWLPVVLNGWDVKVYGWKEGRETKWWNDEQRFSYPPLDEPNGRRGREWNFIKVNGFEAPVWGWREGSVIRWCDDIQKWSYSKRGDLAPPPNSGDLNVPSDVPRSPTGEPFLFGVNATMLGQDGTKIRASDPETKAEAVAILESSEDDEATGKNGFLASKVFRLWLWLKGWTMEELIIRSLVALVVLVGAVVLVVKRNRSNLP